MLWVNGQIYPDSQKGHPMKDIKSNFIEISPNLVLMLEFSPAILMLHCLVGLIYGLNILHFRKKKHFFNFEAHLGTLYEKYIQNFQKNGTFISPDNYEKIIFLTKIYFFQKIWPFPENKATTFFALCHF